MKIAKYIIIGVLALSMVAGMVACNTAPSVDKTTETESFRRFKRGDKERIS